MSKIQFPDVFADYQKHYSKFGKVTNLHTREFLTPMQIGQSTSFTVDKTNFDVSLVNVSQIHNGASTVIFKVNGKEQSVNVIAKHADKLPFILRQTGSQSTTSTTTSSSTLAKADPNKPTQVGASLAGVVSKVFKKVGDKVTKNEPIVLLSAMKMEITVVAPADGKLKSISIKETDSVTTGTLLFEIEV